MLYNADKLLALATDLEKQATESLTEKSGVAARALDLASRLKGMLQGRLDSIRGDSEQSEELRFVVQTQIRYLDEIEQAIKTLAG